MTHHATDIHRRVVRGSRGFSLIELLLAIFILGVGVISVAAVFPAGIIQQRRTSDDVFGPVVAEAALSTIRSRLSQGDFGTFEEFGFFGPGDFSSLDNTFPNGWLNPGDAYTQPGDWPWIRPSIAAVPPGESPDDKAYAGDLDIFSARASRSSSFVPPGLDYPGDLQWDGGWTTSEFSIFGSLPAVGQTYGQTDGQDPGAFLFGIPFNRAKFDLFGEGEDPLVEITQEERFWPAGTGFDGGQPRPQYAWDCMFRRFQGRVQVAIFVYRLNVGNATGGYAVSRDEGASGVTRDGSRPPIPARVDLKPEIDILGSSYTSITPDGPATTDADRNIVPGTYPNFNLASNQISLDPYFEGWQAPGQWFIDPYGRTHRVLQGRRNKKQGPVRLSRGAPNQAPNTAYYNPAAQGEGALDPDVWRQACEEVRSIWFVPPVDRRGISLTPIYVAVRDL